jgi:peptidoglycan/LPS O-acetylase OafA/YrhL
VTEVNVDKTRALRSDTVFLRFLAIILILNSHLDFYYPVRYIGTGGAIGNVLFFMLSSFGLLLSERARPDRFTSWYTKRIKRIYPSVWVVTVILLIPKQLILKQFEITEILDFMSRFFYPRFWFLQTLLFFYFFGWFVIKKFSIKKLAIVTSMFIIVYFLLYVFALDLSSFSIEALPFKIVYYFIVFLFGIYMASINESLKYDGVRDFILAFLSVVIIYGHKFLMTKGILAELQIVQHIFGIVLAYYLFKVSRSPLIQDRLMQSAASQVVKYVSNITLEIYIVHIILGRIFLDLDLAFPFDMILFLTATFLLSSWVKKLAQLLVSQKMFSDVPVA